MTKLQSIDPEGLGKEEGVLGVSISLGRGNRKDLIGGLGLVGIEVGGVQWGRSELGRESKG